MIDKTMMTHNIVCVYNSQLYNHLYSFSYMLCCSIMLKNLFYMIISKHVLLLFSFLRYLFYILCLFVVVVAKISFLDVFWELFLCKFISPSIIWQLVERRKPASFEWFGLKHYIYAWYVQFIMKIWKQWKQLS